MTELTLRTELDRQQLEYVGVIRSCADALLAVINDVLDLSRIEAGRLEIDVRPADLPEVVMDTLQMLAPRAQEKGLELVLDVGPDVPAVVRSDALRLRQILLNLLTNAVKFTERGAVTLRFRCDRGAGRLRVEVQDTGIGIPADRLEAIFEPFSQVDASITRRYGGSGLGLAICRRLAALLGGQVDVRSVVAEGSTFGLTLPVGPAAGAATWCPARSLAGIRVLVAHDDPTLARVLERTLRSWGAVVGVARSASETLAVCGDGDWDAVLVASRLGMDDGVALATRIRAQVGGGVAVTAPARVLAEEGPRCQAAGLETCVPRPIDPRRLATLMDTLLARPDGADADTQALADLDLAGGSHRGRVLLVEDNLVNQMVASEMLQIWGFAVDVADTGQAALDRGSHDYDLVLMDVEMPIMGGLEATRLLRQREAPDRRVPIIAMTAHALSQHRAACLDAGMDDFVTKPVRMDALRAVLDRWKPAPRIAAGRSGPEALAPPDRLQ